jgi:hypothetical protein
MYITDSCNINSIIFNTANKLTNSFNNKNEFQYFIGKYNNIDIIFEKNGCLSKMLLIDNITIINIYNDGSVFCNINTPYRIPLILLYVSIHILQNYEKSTMINKYNINSILPKDILKDLFWFGEYQYDDLKEYIVDIYDITEPIESGVIISLNLYGSTISFKDAVNELLTSENIPKNYDMPICIIKTPDGIMIDENKFQFDDNWDCQEFLNKLHYLMMQSHKNKKELYYNYTLPFTQIYIENCKLSETSHIIYTTLNNIVFDHEQKTFYVIWKII